MVDADASGIYDVNATGVAIHMFLTFNYPVKHSYLYNLLVFILLT